MSRIRRLLGTFLAIALVSANSYALEVDHKGTSILLSGEIMSGDFEKVETALNRKLAPIHLDSDGGQVLEAIKIGELIRSKSLETRLPYKSSCASACMLLLAAGVIRTADETSRIGIHMSSGVFNEELVSKLEELISSDGIAVVPLIVSIFEKQAGLVTLKQVDYLMRMGVSLDLLKRATSVHHLDIEWLTIDDALKYNIINYN
jgi:hypothetical protein